MLYSNETKATMNLPDGRTVVPGDEVEIDERAAQEPYTALRIRTKRLAPVKAKPKAKAEPAPELPPVDDDGPAEEGED